VQSFFIDFPVVLVGRVALIGRVVLVVFVAFFEAFEISFIFWVEKGPGLRTFAAFESTVTLAIVWIVVWQLGTALSDRSHRAGTTAVLRAEGAESGFIVQAVSLSFDGLSRTVVASKSAVVRLTLSKRIVALALTVSGIESRTVGAIVLSDWAPTLTILGV